VRFELFVGVAEVALDGGILDGSVHAFDLLVSPGMVWLGQLVSDPMKEGEPIEGPIPIALSCDAAAGFSARSFLVTKQTACHQSSGFCLAATLLGDPYW
jgi:hypothetical protein